jgi:hypothetical protein
MDGPALDPLEKINHRLAELDVRLIEQEHRLVAVWRNWWRYRKGAPAWDATTQEREQWDLRRRAAHWALLWRYVAPETVAAGAASVAAIVGVAASLGAVYFSAEQARYAREQTSQLRDAYQTDIMFRARSRIADLADRIMARSDCASPDVCTVDGGRYCPFEHNLAARRAAANEYMWLLHAFKDQTGVEQVQLAHASLTWFEAQPDTPFAGASFYGADFRCAVFRTKSGRALSFRGTDFRDANLECALFAEDSDTADVMWEGARCPDGVVADEQARRTCAGHLQRPHSCNQRCGDAAFTQSPAFPCPSTVE